MNDSRIQALKDAEKQRITVEDVDIFELKSDERDQAVATSTANQSVGNTRRFPGMILFVIGVALVATGNWWAIFIMWPAIGMFNGDCGTSAGSDHQESDNSQSFWQWIWIPFAFVFLTGTNWNILLPMILICAGISILHSRRQNEAV